MLYALPKRVPVAQGIEPLPSNQQTLNDGARRPQGKPCRLFRLAVGTLSNRGSWRMTFKNAGFLNYQRIEFGLGQERYRLAGRTPQGLQTDRNIGADQA